MIESIQWSELPMIDPVDLESISGAGWKKTLLKWTGAAIGGGVGAWGGTAVGTLVGGPPGAIIGGGAGSGLGAAIGYDAGDAVGSWIEDRPKTTWVNPK